MKALALVLLLPSLVFATPAAPEIHQPVVDQAGLLSAQEQEQVASALVGLREKTGAQLAVLIVDTTSGEPIEDYAIRVARQWRGGQGGANNGLLYVLAVKDHRMRLDVGYGLEEFLPDDVVRRLLDAQTPRMRQKDFTGALLAIIAGVSERLPAVSGSPSAVTPSPQTPAPSAEAERDERVLKVLLITLMVMFLPCAFCLRPRLRQWMGGRLTVVLGGTALFVSLRVIFGAAWGSPSLIALALLLLAGSTGSFFLGQYLLVKTGWMRLGCCLMMGTLLGMVVALEAPPSELLAVVGISTLFFTVILQLASLMLIGNVLVVPWMLVFGGRAIFQKWRAPTQARSYSSSGLKPSVAPPPSPSSASSASLVGVYSPSSPNTPTQPAAPRPASTDSSTPLVGVYSPSTAEVASSSFPEPSPASSWDTSSSSSSWDSSSSSSSSWDSSSSSSSSWDSSSSSSSSTDWSGGGGDFGGGGASSSW